MDAPRVNRVYSSIIRRERIIIAINIEGTLDLGGEYMGSTIAKAKYPIKAVTKKMSPMAFSFMR